MRRVLASFELQRDGRVALDIAQRAVYRLAAVLRDIEKKPPAANFSLRGVRFQKANRTGCRDDIV
jgi:hypothetical protein